MAGITSRHGFKSLDGRQKKCPSIEEHIINIKQNIKL